MPNSNLIPLSNVGAFSTGRKRAGMGWYTGQRPLWMEIAVPAVEGTSRGVQAGLSAYAGGAGGGGTSGGTSQAGMTKAVTNANSSQAASQQGSPAPTIGGGPTLEDYIMRGGDDPATGWGRPLGGLDPETGLDPSTRDSQSLTITEPAQPGETPVQKQERLARQEKRNRILWAVIASQGGSGQSQSYIRSSRTLKREIEPNDDRRALGEVLKTPVYRYRYYDEPEGTQPRIGPMAEEVPPSWQSPDKHGIKMPVMIGQLMAATRALGRDVETLKERLHG